jgi:hypothetical protein
MKKRVVNYERKKNKAGVGLVSKKKAAGSCSKGGKRGT